MLIRRFSLARQCHPPYNPILSGVHAETEICPYVRGAMLLVDFTSDTSLEITSSDPVSKIYAPTEPPKLSESFLPSLCTYLVTLGSYPKIKS